MNEAFHITPSSAIERSQAQEGLSDYEDQQDSQWLETLGYYAQEAHCYCNAQQAIQEVQDALQRADSVPFDMAVRLASIYPQLIDDITGYHRDLSCQDIMAALASPAHNRRAFETAYSSLALSEKISAFHLLNEEELSELDRLFFPEDMRMVFFEQNEQYGQFLRLLIERWPNFVLDEARSIVLEQAQRLPALCDFVEESVAAGNDTYLSLFMRSLYGLSEHIASYLLANGNSQLLLENVHRFAGLPPETDQVLGFELSRLMNAWREEGNTNMAFSEVVRQNIEVVRELEKTRPGSVQYLMQHYGICSFYRYPPELLLKQIDLPEKKLSYGAVLYPRGDWNGAFVYPYFFKILEHTLDEATNSSCKIIIAECASNRELARTLLTLTAEHGPMLFLVIGGHGDGKGVQLGSYQPMWQSKGKARLTINDITSLRDDWERADSIIHPDAPILYESCSAGIPNGIAEITSDKFNLFVTGPDCPSSINDIDIGKSSEEALRFSIKYSYGAVQKDYPKYSGAVRKS